MSSEEMAKERAVVEFIVKNKLSNEEAKKYMEEQGVTVRIMSLAKANEEIPADESGRDRFGGQSAEELPIDEIDEEILDRVWSSIATEKNSLSYVRNVLQMWAQPIISS